MDTNKIISESRNYLRRIKIYPVYYLENELLLKKLLSVWVAMPFKCNKIWYEGSMEEKSSLLGGALDKQIEYIWGCYDIDMVLVSNMVDLPLDMIKKGIERIKKLCFALPMVLHPEVKKSFNIRGGGKKKEVKKRKEGDGG
jgi:hypothetical protein